MSTTCPRCGAETTPEAASCPRCGQPLAEGGQSAWDQHQPSSGPGPGSGVGAGPGDRDAGNLSLLAHLSALVAFIGIPSFVGPLVVWLWQREAHPFVAEHAREALNFNLSVLLYTVVGGVLAAVFAVLTLGLGILVIAPVVAVFAIAWFALVVVAAVRASRREPYRYPVTIRFVR